MNLIGKNVNALNYSEWKQRRLRSYAALLMLSPKDASNFRILPIVRLCNEILLRGEEFLANKTVVFHRVHGTIKTARANKYRDENRCQLTKRS